MPYCKSCGEKLIDGAQYCLKCGARCDETVSTVVDKPNSPATPDSSHKHIHVYWRWNVTDLTIDNGKVSILKKRDPGFFKPKVLEDWTRSLSELKSIDQHGTIIARYLIGGALAALYAIISLFNNDMKSCLIFAAVSAVILFLGHGIKLTLSWSNGTTTAIHMSSSGEAEQIISALTNTRR